MYSNTCCLLVNFIQASYANKSLLIYQKKYVLKMNLFTKTESELENKLMDFQKERWSGREIRVEVIHYYTYNR